MCEHLPAKRIQQFAAIDKSIQSDLFFEIDFEEDETEAYRAFADAVEQQVTKLEAKARYHEDIDRVQVALENAYRSFMLEREVPDSATVTRCLIDGAYYYKKKGFPVWPVKAFLHLLKSSPVEKKRIVLANLHTRLDAITRYDADNEVKDNLPF
jgi:eukaryotic-like serine/threonine-protein kinase